MISMSFNPPLWEADHLKIEEVGRAYAVTWPEGNVTIHSRKSDEPDHRDLLRRNPSLRFHGMFGYSLSTYHEFFVGALDDYAEFKLGPVYVTFGEVTPLARFIFSADYHRKVHGDDWNYFSTVRLEGAAADLVEAYLLNALQVYDDAFFEQQPILLPFGPVEWSEPTEPKYLPKFVRSIPGDIEPLRFFYHGRRESEHESACLQFYRVLEFYAFLELQSEVATLRADVAIDPYIPETYR